MKGEEMRNTKKFPMYYITVQNAFEVNHQKSLACATARECLVRNGDIPDDCEAGL